MSEFAAKLNGLLGPLLELDRIDIAGLVYTDLINRGYIPELCPRKCFTSMAEIELTLSPPNKSSLLKTVIACDGYIVRGGLCNVCDGCELYNNPNHQMKVEYPFGNNGLDRRKLRTR